MQLEQQIISNLRNKIEKEEDFSNRSRIRNKILLNSYLETFNNNSNNLKL